MRRRRREHVHVERVAGRHARRPRPVGEHLPRHDRTEAIEQHTGERLLDRRQRNPRVAVMQQPVLVEQRPDRMLARPQHKGMPTGIDLPLRCPGGHPVLETVDGQRQLAVAVGHHEQPRYTHFPKLSETLCIGRPADHLDVHGADRTGYLLRPCYPAVTCGGLPRPPSEFAEVPGRGHHGRAQAPARMLAEPVDRPADADRRDDRRRARRTPARSRWRRPPRARPRSRPSPRLRTAASSFRVDLEARGVRRPRPGAPCRPTPGRAAAPRRAARCRAARSAVRAPRHTPGDRLRARRAARSRPSPRRDAPAPGGPHRARPRPATAPHAASRRPSRKRPSASRTTTPWRSSATASRYAVGRGELGLALEVGQRARSPTRDRVEDAEPRDRAPGCHSLH